MKTGFTDLPLHGGKAPVWLFSRMVALSRAIFEIMFSEFPKEEILRRLADPFWFQSLGNLLGFDWHSSGLTTTTTAALKEALKPLMFEAGFFVAGGKGKISLRTPQEIEEICYKTGTDATPLIRSSRMAAKVDSSLVQDGYQIYHHTIFFTDTGLWAVVQQGMNESNRYARRYHWLSEKIKTFVVEPHTGIHAQRREKLVLNLTSRDSLKNQEATLQLIQRPPEKTIKLIEKIKQLRLPPRHQLLLEDINPGNFRKIMALSYEKKPETFEELVEIKGVGGKFLRALSLTADVIFGASVSFEDPAVYSYAHGGKDGTPYPVDRRIYDKTIEVLEKAIKQAKIGQKDKIKALKKLANLFGGAP